MQNKFITVHGTIYRIDTILYITPLQEHNRSQYYFRIHFDDSHKDVEFDFVTYNVTENDKKVFLTKLENEFKKLETFLVDGTGPNRFFVTIDLRK